MIRIKSAVAAALGLGLMASVAHAATPLAVGSGWQYGQDNAKNANEVGWPITFTVSNAGGDAFSLTDGYAPGDVFKVFVTAGPFTFSTLSTFTSYPSTFNNNLGPYATPFAADWLNASYSHLQIILSPGTYTVRVQDTSTVGYPAGFGYRLDAVPEPAGWALMLLGLGTLGLGLRGARARSPRAT